MYRHARAALAGIALLFVSVPRLVFGAETITIISVGDTHSHLDAVGPKDLLLNGTVGGLAKAATVISVLKATEPNPVFVHAGDLFNEEMYFVAGLGPGGAPLLSVPEMQMLAGLGLDVMTLGNHEVSLGTDILASVLIAAFQDGGPSVLSANLDIDAAGLDGLVGPRVVKKIGNLSVGFFGMTIVDFISQKAPFLPASYSAEGLIGLAASEAATLRAPPYSADVVICVAHLGRELEEAIAANAPGIDLVIGAHDHLALYETVPGPSGSLVPVVKAGEFYKFVGKVKLSVDSGQVSVVAHDLIPIDAEVPRLEPVKTTVKQLQAAIDQRYGEDFWRVPIALALTDIAKDASPGSRQRDSGIGNLVTDALRDSGRTDLGLTVNGFIPDGLPRGFLVRDDAFRIVGDGIDPSNSVIGFPLYRIKITGQNLMAALTTALAYGSDLFVQVSGMTYTFDGSTGKVQSVKVGGRDLNLHRVYTATVNLGVVMGLQEFPDVHLVGRPKPLGIGEYTAVSDFMQKLYLVQYASEGRIIDTSIQ